MQKTLHQTNITIYVGGYEINNLRFADDIDLIAGTNADLQTCKNAKPLIIMYYMYKFITSLGVHLYPLFVLYSIYIYIYIYMRFQYYFYIYIYLLFFIYYYIFGGTLTFDSLIYNLFL